VRVDGGVGGSAARDSPLVIDAAFQLIANRERAGERLRQRELALEQRAMTHARRYDAVDPDSWSASSNAGGNERLAAAARLRSRSKAAERTAARCATTSVRRCCTQDDLPQLWNQPAAFNETRKRIYGPSSEIMVTSSADGCAPLHWQGGDHTRLGSGEEPYWAKSLEDRRGDRATGP
jgi:hypothetical protein